MNMVYTIEDGTGSTDVRKWIEQNETEEEAEDRRALV
jgi:replication factor A2